MSIQVPREALAAAPTIQWKHVDGPLLHWAGHLHWLTWWERIKLELGFTTPEEIAHNRFGRAWSP